MNKLSHIESQRIMALIEESLLKMQLISLMTRDSASIPVDISELITDDLQFKLKRHKNLEDQLSELINNKRHDTSEVHFIMNSLT